MRYGYICSVMQLISQSHRDTTKTGDVIISSERHRTQTMNLEDAWEKMFEFVKNVVDVRAPTAVYAVERKEKL